MWAMASVLCERTSGSASAAAVGEPLSDGELLWITLDVGCKGAVSHDELVQWSGVMLAAAGVHREEALVPIGLLSRL